MCPHTPNTVLPAFFCSTMFRVVVFLMLLLWTSCDGLLQPADLRPIIGIVAWPMHDEPRAQDASETMPYQGPHKYYMPASYVKWVESAGARAAPVLMNATTEEVRALLRQLNGVLLIGGGGNITKGSTIRQFTELVYQEVLLLP